MGALHPTRDIARAPKGSLKGQRFVAYVIKNDDSDHPDKKKRQRAVLRIPGWHRNIPDDKLPWGMPEQSGEANSGGGVGTVDVPPVGAKVYVTFDEDDPHSMRYSGSPTTDDVTKDHEGLKEDYPNTQMTVDRSGNKRSVNHKKSTVTDTVKSGATIHRDKEGNLYLYAPKKLILGSGEGITLATKGGLQMHAKGDTSIKGGKIDLNGSDTAVEPTAVGERDAPKIPSPANKKDGKSGG